MLCVAVVVAAYVDVVAVADAVLVADDGHDDDGHDDEHGIGTA